MSLKKQISILLATVLCLAYAGTLYISIKSTQEYLNNQLAVHAQDTATSLGLSLAPVIRQQDLAQANSMIDVIFDHGYYKHISLNAWQGKFRVERNLDVWTAKSPGWFIQLLKLDTPLRSSEILVDWKNRAQLSVSIHPGYAYDELWKITRNNILWLSLITAFISLLVFYGLRALLVPLLRTEQQALAIAKKEYIFQDELPHARELRNVVTAMNMMTEKVKVNIETLLEQANSYQQLAYLDALTGLANRRCYLAEVENFINQKDTFGNGAILLIHLSGLRAANEKQGYEYGDAALKTVARSLQSLNMEEGKHLLARISGSDFSVLLKNPHRHEAVDCAEHILKEYALLADSHYSGDLSVGIVEFDSAQETRSLLAEADQAQRQAASLPTEKWYRFESARQSDTRTASEWRILLSEAIEREEFEFHLQTIKYFNGAHPDLFEVLLRVRQENNTVPASVFLTTAQEQTVLDKIDRLVVKRVLEFADENPTILYAVNLNIANLENASFVTWLLECLADAGDKARQLLFEVGESGKLTLDTIQDVLNQLANASAGVAVEHFGGGRQDFGYLMKLKLRYIKISGQYIRYIEDNKEHQFYLTALLKMAHSLELDVIAESVETETVARKLEALGFDAMQGYYIGHPQPI